MSITRRAFPRIGSCSSNITPFVRLGRAAASGAGFARGHPNGLPAAAIWALGARCGRRLLQYGRPPRRVDLRDFVHRAVDDDPSPGRFLLTGSARPSRATPTRVRAGSSDSGCAGSRWPSAAKRADGEPARTPRRTSPAPRRHLLGWVGSLRRRGVPLELSRASLAVWTGPAHPARRLPRSRRRLRPRGARATDAIGWCAPTLDDGLRRSHRDHRHLRRHPRRGDTGRTGQAGKGDRAGVSGRVGAAVDPRSASGEAAHVEPPPPPRLDTATPPGRPGACGAVPGGASGRAART
jgi:hypothetical protein